MLLAYERLLDVDYVAFLVFVAAAMGAFVIGTAFHEFSHAASALALGDRTAQAAGRVTLNPLAHLDPAGTVLLLLAGFGWGRPVPVNPSRLRGGMQASAMVSFAGPAANFVIAAIATLLLHLTPIPVRHPFDAGAYLGVDWSFVDYVGLLLSATVFFNVILGIFNLIPVAPLDGFKVALGILPRDLAMEYSRTERYGPGILLVLILVLPYMLGISVLGPVVRFISDILLGA
ncbi:MAG: site-2 protease family protein [Dehalococcoidia bacterium]|nr:site-2 protease family protein [Dehalococcoidia bacterium]